MLNTSLPEYVRECIDKDAQANYVRSLIGSTLTDFLQQIKQEAEEAARQQWQKDRMDLANKSSEASKQMNEYKTKNEELRNRILSLDIRKPRSTTAYRHWKTALPQRRLNASSISWNAKV